jgi:hypothetical protein
MSLRLSARSRTIREARTRAQHGRPGRGGGEEKESRIWRRLRLCRFRTLNCSHFLVGWMAKYPPSALVSTCRHWQHRRVYCCDLPHLATAVAEGRVFKNKKGGRQLANLSVLAFCQCFSLTFGCNSEVLDSWLSNVPGGRRRCEWGAVCPCQALIRAQNSGLWRAHNLGSRHSQCGFSCCACTGSLGTIRMRIIPKKPR